MRKITICKTLIVITVAIFAACTPTDNNEAASSSDTVEDRTGERSSDNIEDHKRFSGVGSVNSIDKEEGKVKIEATYVPGWAPRPMTFENVDPKMLNELEPGDDVDFTFDREGTNFTLVEITKSKSDDQ